MGLTDPIADVRMKIRRAEEHLGNLQVALAPLTESRPHLLRESKEQVGKKTRTLLRLEVTGTIDPTMAVMAGGFLHNLRGALDYTVYALNPPKHRDRQLQFPIYDINVWAMEPGTRKYLRRDKGSVARRGHFRRTTAGIHPDATAIIKGLQPGVVAPHRLKEYVLLTLNKLNNADKHRKLIVILKGVPRPSPL